MYIRVWQPCNIQEMSKHLLIVGDITADCQNCRELGIDYTQTRNCPKCGTDFRFISVRSTSGGSVKRIKERRPDLVMIDYDDYKHLTGKQSARDFFK